MNSFARRMLVLVPWVVALGCGGDSSTKLQRGDGAICWPTDNVTGEPVACEGAEINEQILDLLAPCVLPNVPACTAARCVPPELLPESADPNDLADCTTEDGSGKCVPDALAATMGEFLLSSCTAANGEEGRCLSPCVPRVAANAAVLIQDICQDGWLCSPCFENGVATGACDQGCDPGPSDPASGLCE